MTDTLLLDDNDSTFWDSIEIANDSSTGLGWASLALVKETEEPKEVQACMQQKNRFPKNVERKRDPFDWKKEQENKLNDIITRRRSSARAAKSDQADTEQREHGKPKVRRTRSSASQNDLNRASRRTSSDRFTAKFRRSLTDDSSSSVQQSSTALELRRSRHSLRTQSSRSAVLCTDLELDEKHNASFGTVSTCSTSSSASRSYQRRHETSVCREKHALQVSIGESKTQLPCTKSSSSRPKTTIGRRLPVQEVNEVEQELTLEEVFCPSKDDNDAFDVSSLSLSFSKTKLGIESIANMVASNTTLDFEKVTNVVSTDNHKT